MNITQALQKPLESLDGQNVQATFQTIATNLFNNFYIRCGKKIFYFAEVEFYYYKKDVFEHDYDIAYKRKGYETGDLFYHLSGVDICFNSNEKEYGGILVRSLIEISSDSGNTNEHKKVIAGPMNCVRAMLNACKKQDLVPQLLELTFDRKVKPESTYRYFGDEDRKKIIKRHGNKDGDKKLAYYDPTIQKDEWDSVDENGKKKYYYTHRFVY